MPRSVYFSQGTKNEINLYEDIVVEGLKTYGYDMLYIPRDIVNVDNIFQEDIQSQFNDAYSIEMYIENVSGFEGEGSILSKFGLEIRDSAEFIVARRSWEKFVGIQNNMVNSMRPREGDLVYLPLTKALFEIKFVEHEKPFYQVSDLPVYQLSVELFEYSGEDLNTGVEDIDDIQLVNDFAVTFTTSAELLPGLNITDGMEVKQWVDDAETIAVTGNVSVYEYDDVALTGIISIVNIGTTDGKYHMFESGKELVLTDGSAWTTLVAEAELDDVNDEGAKNDHFNIEASDILDFSENNPFGEL